MITNYKFFKSKDGITAFAVVELSSSPADHWEIQWENSPAKLRHLFGEAIENGVYDAANEHKKRGGYPQTIKIVSLIESPADTKSDAVRCAATMAAWKNWGYSENEADIIYEDSIWKVIFKPIHK